MTSAESAGDSRAGAPGEHSAEHRGERSKRGRARARAREGLAELLDDLAGADDDLDRLLDGLAAECEIDADALAADLGDPDALAIELLDDLAADLGVPAPADMPTETELRASVDRLMAREGRARVRAGGEHAVPAGG